MARRRIVSVSAGAAMVLLLALAPGAYSWFSVERRWVRPTTESLGYGTVDRWSGRLHGRTEIWSTTTGELLARGEFRRGEGTLSAGAPSFLTIERPAWTTDELPHAIANVVHVGSTWPPGRRPDRSVPPPWERVRTSPDEFWAERSRD